MQKLASSITYARAKGWGAALKAVVWRIKTAASKRRISLEDRYGWYSYPEWIRDFERTPVNSPEKIEHNERVQPRFSLILRAGAAPFPTIKVPLASFQSQTFPSWEALVALPQDSADLPPDVSDQRIRIEPLPEGSGLVQAALDIVKGEFVLLLDAGDAIHPDTLAVIAATLEQSPDLEIIYTDEDRLAENGERQMPFFKPDWSPELLISINYLSNAFFKRELLQQATASFDGNGLTWENLVWICAEKARQIQHIPRVLVHKGINAPSTSPTQRSLEQLRAHLQRTGFPEPTVGTDANGMTQVQWPVRGDKVSIIIPTKDRLEYIRRCVESILEITQYPDFEIILVDSGSIEAETLEYYEQLKAIPNLRLLPYESPFNFSGALNEGAQAADGTILIFLNNDTQIIEGEWLVELVRWAERPEIGIVGGQLHFPDGSIQHAGIVIGLEGHASHVFGGDLPGVSGPFGSVSWYRNYTAVTGACMAMPKDVFHKIGGFDEEYQLVFSDIEICLRAIQAGYRVMYTPFARLLHHEGTRQRYIPGQDIALAYDHLKDLVASGDPHFNPNLSTAVRNPTFRRPGEEPAIERLQAIVDQVDWEEEKK